MKYFLKITLAVAFLISLQACGTDSNSDDDEQTGTFDVPFEMFIPATQIEDGRWVVTNGGFQATFNPRGNAMQYELRVVREDNTKEDPFIYSHGQLLGHRPESSELIYFVRIGSSFLHSGVSDDEKNRLVNEIQQELNENKHFYQKLEVTPLFD